MSQPGSFGNARPIIPRGTQLNGIYEIDEPIAAGGMGEIYKGHTIQTGDPVAIKLIRQDVAEAEAAFALFRKEASALHNLYHEAIVRYYVFTVDPILQRPYLAMEYVDGQSLSEMLNSGPLAYEAVYRLMHRIAAGLQAAHERGIVHRDVSPDNIIIPAGEMGRAKIIDFGIARSTRLGDDGTVIGSGFAGKYNYVSPEQLGLFGGEVTPRSDIYSLGLVLAEALRHGPIDMGGSHVDVIDKRRHVPDVGPIDSRLRPLIEKMLQPDPKDRPTSMAEIAAWTTGTKTTVRQARLSPKQKPAVYAPRPQSSAQRLMLIGGAAIAAVALIGFGIFALLPSNPLPQRREAPKLQAENTPTLTTTEPQTQILPGAPEPSSVKPGLAPMDFGKLALGPSSDATLSQMLDEPGVDPGKVDALRRYINQYDGGDCFYLKPVQIAASSVTLEGFGASDTPFRELDTAFRRAHGFDADIGFRQIAAGQCPAVKLLNQLRASARTAPFIALASTSVKPGQSLQGTLLGLDGRTADVFLVTDDGSVRALSTTAGGNNKLSFSLNPDSELANGKAQMLIAIAHGSDAAETKTPKPDVAARFFPQLGTQMEKNEDHGNTAVAKLFTVDQ